MPQQTVSLVPLRIHGGVLQYLANNGVWQTVDTAPGILVEGGGTATSIGNMSAAGALTGTEVTVLVQSGGDVQETLSGLAAFVGASPVPVVHIATTSHTLAAGDAGKILSFENAGASTLNVPAGVVSGGYEVQVLDMVTSGGVTVAPTSGVTLVNRQSHSATAGSGSVAALVGQNTDVVVLGGDTA